ncbi:HAD-like domain [Pseudocohnilembus persalinus]|uniref:HAD-like domain n=1 Tax=Pseudocohnilembus persalinus TaxID=266149 RepID=A0A0V0R7G0_PSEPJ|nr:HAD-like domain [Pseudocohnilembus persalinus]|eukprot:KRX10266.1 HAD-like domain [Pseudocohnilembus persalinus]
MAQRLTQKISSLSEVINDYENYFFDMDGVFWVGEDKIQTAVDQVNNLQKNNKNVFFITNNSSRSRQTYVERLQKFGIKTELKNVFSASSIVADYLVKKHPEVQKAYVVGMQGICEELQLKNVDYQFSDIHNNNDEVTVQEFKEMQPDKDIGAVIIGIDYHFNYRKLCYASLCIQQGALFLATNPDTHIMIGGRKMPGGGTGVNALATAVQQEPILTGKPNRFIVDMLIQDYNLQREQCIMIGDNMDTDIKLGENSDISSLLVLTGNNYKLVLN